MNLRVIILTILSLITLFTILRTEFKMWIMYQTHKEKALLSLMICLIFYSLIGLIKLLGSEFAFNIIISLMVFFLIQFTYQTFHKETKSVHSLILGIIVLLSLISFYLGIYRDLNSYSDYHHWNNGIISILIWISAIWLISSSMKSYFFLKEIQINRYIRLRLKYMAMLGCLFFIQGFTNYFYVLSIEGSTLKLILAFLNATIVLLFSLGMFYTWVIIKKDNESPIL